MLFGRSDDFSKLDVVFLTREGCGLCVDAIAAVEDVRRKHPFPLRTIYIEPGDDWYAAYWDKIPVVLIDGQVEFTARVEADTLLRRLRECSRNNRTA